MQAFVCPEHTLWLSVVTLQIGKAPVSAEFIRFSKQNFYNRLLHKLSNWS